MKSPSTPLVALFKNWTARIYSHHEKRRREGSKGIEGEEGKPRLLLVRAANVCTSPLFLLRTEKPCSPFSATSSPYRWVSSLRHLAFFSLGQKNDIFLLPEKSLRAFKIAPGFCYRFETRSSTPHLRPPPLTSPRHPLGIAWRNHRCQARFSFARPPPPLPILRHRLPLKIALRDDRFRKQYPPPSQRHLCAPSTCTYKYTVEFSFQFHRVIRWVHAVRPITPAPSSTVSSHRRCLPCVCCDISRPPRLWNFAPQPLQASQTRSTTINFSSSTNPSLHPFQVRSACPCLPARR